jgi:gas vesicle protein
MRPKEVNMSDRTAYVTSAFYFLVGAVTGASVALLVAPQAGEITRDMVRLKLHDGADSARHLKDRVVRRGAEVGEEAAHRVTDAASALAGRGPRQAVAQKEETPTT